MRRGSVFHQSKGVLQHGVPGKNEIAFLWKGQSSLPSNDRDAPFAPMVVFCRAGGGVGSAVAP